MLKMIQEIGTVNAKHQYKLHIFRENTHEKLISQRNTQDGNNTPMNQILQNLQTSSLYCISKFQSTDCCFWITTITIKHLVIQYSPISSLRKKFNIEPKAKNARTEINSINHTFMFLRQFYRFSRNFNNSKIFICYL